MKKNIVLIFLILPFFTFSQTISLNRNINWNENKTFSQNEKKIELLSFDNAIYFDSKVPMYGEVINLNELDIFTTDIDVKITNKKYEKIESKSFDETDKKLITNEIKLKFSSAKGRDIYYLDIEFYPFRNINGIYEKLTSFDIEIIPNNKPIIKKLRYLDNSVLSSGKWEKIGIPKTGVYKLTFAQLNSMGFSNPQSVRVFGNDKGQLPDMLESQIYDDLTENKIFRGSDYILFYAKSSDNWYRNSDTSMFLRKKNIFTDTAYYFITDKNTGFDNIISNYSQPSQSQNFTINKFIFYDIVEQQLHNIGNSGQVWLGESFLYEQQKNYTFNLPSAVNGETAKVAISSAVRSLSNSSFDYTVGGQTHNVDFRYVTGVHYSLLADYKTKKYNVTQNSNTLNLTLKYNKSTSSSEAWLDYIVVNAICSLSFFEQIEFRSNENIGENNVSKFEMTNANSSIKIWEVTNPTLPQNIAYTLNSQTLSFKFLTDTLREFIAFTDANCLTPTIYANGIGSVANQNLHSVNPNTELIIVTHKDFLSQANQIATMHRNHDKLNVVVVTTEQIYNEFSCGMKDAAAIRNYAKMVYDKTNGKLCHMLLFGDGTYDNFSETTELNPNFIPTYETFDSFNDGILSMVVDDYFSFLDVGENVITGKMDIAIGRYPVKNTQEADVMVTKLSNYYNTNSFGDWKNIITLVTDDYDAGGDTFVNDAETLASNINENIPNINIKKIYLDAYQQQTSSNGEEYPEAVVDLNNRINNGSLIVNYIGHGSEVALSAERLVTIHEINGWNNIEKLSLFITGTCEFSRYDNASIESDETSAGEMVILNPIGGAIALLTTSRVTYAYTNLQINNRFYDYLFQKNGNKYYTIGDAYRLAKNEMTGSLRLIFVLLGNPAVRLQYPTLNVETSKINGIDISNFNDTLKALQEVTINGFVKNYNGNLYETFNGNIILSYFDKVKQFETLNNDGNGPLEYWSQFNLLFRGKAKVKNGLFSINFIIPKDIYYNYGNSKLSYYVYNNNEEAAGNIRNILLGGIDSNAVADIVGPEIRLFMNDSNFVSGGITNTNPSIYAILYDKSGINISSSSIGHDITAMLDNNSNKVYSLNEYYITETDNYKRGIVDFGLYKIEEGAHSVKLKAWDVYNNSSDKNIDFMVLENNNLVIEHLLNYPNPFTTKTSFYFEHNKPNVELNIILQIFSVSGKVVKTIRTNIISTGYRSEPITWDGLDDFGSPIGKGVYLYTLKIRTPDGKIVEKTEKLLILK